MCLQVRRQRIQGFLDHRLEGDTLEAAAPEPGEEGVAEAVGGEKAVHVGPHHPPVGRARAFRAATFEPQPGALQIGARGLAHVHLITPDGLIGSNLRAGHFGKGFGAGDHRFHTQEPQALGLGRAPPAPACLAYGATPPPPSPSPMRGRGVTSRSG